MHRAAAVVAYMSCCSKCARATLCRKTVISRQSTRDTDRRMRRIVMSRRHFSHRRRMRWPPNQVASNSMRQNRCQHSTSASTNTSAHVPPSAAPCTLGWRIMRRWPQHRHLVEAPGIGQDKHPTMLTTGALGCRRRLRPTTGCWNVSCVRACRCRRCPQGDPSGHYVHPAYR